MKKKINYFIIIMLFVVCVQADWSVRSLRTKLRANAFNQGVELSNCWTRIDKARKLLTAGGSLNSTNSQHLFFQSLTNCIPFLMKVDQSIKTPEESIYPRFFLIGFDPYQLPVETNNSPQKVLQEQNKAFEKMKAGASPMEAVQDVVDDSKKSE